MKNLLLATILAMIVGTAHAIPIEINAVSVDGGALGNVPSPIRGISLLADKSFTISSVGLFSDIGSTSYDVTIYSSTDGNQTTGVLASTTATVGGAGLQWYDIPINFAFNAGNYYAIAWATTSGAVIPGGTGLYFHYGYDANLPLTTGPVTLINGFAEVNTGSGFSNLLHPQLRVDASVPEPATLNLLAVGLAGLSFSRKRKAHRYLCQS